MKLCEDLNSFYRKYPLNLRMIIYPMSTDCIKYISTKFVDYIYLRSFLGANAFTTINSGEDQPHGFGTVNHLTFGIEILEKLNKEKQLEAFVHELVHIHYAEIPWAVNDKKEQLIEDYTTKFLRENKEICEEIYNSFNPKLKPWS